MLPTSNRNVHPLCCVARRCSGFWNHSTHTKYTGWMSATWHWSITVARVNEKAPSSSAAIISSSVISPSCLFLSFAAILEKYLCTYWGFRNSSTAKSRFPTSFFLYLIRATVAASSLWPVFSVPNGNVSSSKHFWRSLKFVVRSRRGGGGGGWGYSLI